MLVTMTVMVVVVAKCSKGIARFSAAASETLSPGMYTDRKIDVLTGLRR